MAFLTYATSLLLFMAVHISCALGDATCTDESCKVPTDPLKAAEHELNRLTAARVCNVLRDANVTKAQGALDAALACTEVTPGLECDAGVLAAERNVQDALLQKCHTPAGSIEHATDKLRAAFLDKMKAAKFEFPFKTIVIEPLHGRADTTITMLHGLNFSIANELPRVLDLMMSGSPRGVRVVMMQAPYRTDSTIIGLQGHIWYPMPSNPFDPWTKAMLDEMYATLQKLYDSSRHVHDAFQLDKDRFGYMGFSFGAITTIGIYLNHDVPAAAALSGTLAAPNDIHHDDSDEAKKRPLLMVNGVDDEYVHVEWSMAGAKKIRSFGRNLHQVLMSGLMHSLQPYRTLFLETGMRFIHDAIGVTQPPLPGTDLTKLNIAPIIWSPNDPFTWEE